MFQLDTQPKALARRAFVSNLHDRVSNCEEETLSIRRLRGAKHTAKGCMGASAQGGAWLFDYWLFVWDEPGRDVGNKSSYDYRYQLFNRGVRSDAELG
jgi:hypothetical protein